jgi:hypothetical protein
MKVKDLIAQLQAQDPEADVHFLQPTKDAKGNIVCPPITDVEKVFLRITEGYEPHILATNKRSGDELVVVLLS